MNAMKTKYLDKKKWRRLVRSKYDETIITCQGEKILAGIIHMHKVREPLSVRVVGEDTLVVATILNGCSSCLKNAITALLSCTMKNGRKYNIILILIILILWSSAKPGGRIYISTFWCC